VRTPAVELLSEARGREAVRRSGRVGPPATKEGRGWRVVDDLPSPVPVSERELDVIERWLAQAGEIQFSGSTAELTRPRIESPPAKTRKLQPEGKETRREVRFPK
jgi:hypothetical protein